MELNLSSVKKAWNTWNINGFIVLSLSLQVLLVLLAPFRKRTSNRFMIFLVWAAYSAADWTPNFVVGLITNNIVQSSISEEKVDLLAFWAPFLVLHLGGPDTISAFALEDNELWLRYLLGVIFQLGASVYIFYVSLPDNKLWIPTVLVLLAGTVKCVERVRALYLASIENFRDSMVPKPDAVVNYSKITGLWFAKLEARIPAEIIVIREPRPTKATSAIRKSPLSDLEMLNCAFEFFRTFKGLFVDFVFSTHVRDQSRNFFLERTPEEAFKQIEAELNLIYEVFYTKVAAARCKLGYTLRFVSLSSIVLVLVLFYQMDKKGFHQFDVGISYTLLLVEMALDTLAIFLLISSDWSAIAVPSDRKLSFKSIAKEIVVSKQRCFACPMQSRMRIFCRRWSESVAQYNFMYYFLHQRSRMDRIVSSLFQKNLPSKPFTDKLRNFIFDELWVKAQIADDLETAKAVCLARGDWVLQINGYTKLLHWITETEYDESILLWHIATELCCADDGNAGDIHYRDISKLLSNYMLHLLVVQPMFTYAVSGIHKIRLLDTYAEANLFFKGEKLELEQACRRILHTNTAVVTAVVKKGISKSVLFEACSLAKNLNEIGDAKWKVMSKVWVELLCHAASRCRAYTHAQQLSKGGQLLTLIWLLMAHFGLGEHFQRDARAKLIVGK